VPATVIIGAQWGDEGKGKVVDLLSESADVVVRYAGGPNAGHTLVVGDDKIVLRLVPSGVLHPHTQCLLGQGMVLNLATLIEELDILAARDVHTAGRVHVSDRAHVLLPYHVTIDGLREASAAEGSKIGTTKRGIGPCYEDKVARRGMRVGDLRDLDLATARIQQALDGWQPVVQALDGELPKIEEIRSALAQQAERLLPLVTDTSALLEDHVRSDKRVMLEGAQGTLLDIDHGTYPFVTSSSAVAGGACTGAGIGPTRIDRVLGISKAYTTRVGSGPFPTELDDAAGKHLRDAGAEFGSVTGRPRRTGWLDVCALRHARRVNGLDGLVLTKLDVLTGLAELRVCVAYDTPNGRTDSIPLADLERAVPVFETLTGWSDDLTACRSLDELPAAARDYMEFVATASDLPIDIVSVGPRRTETIVVNDAFG